MENVGNSIQVPAEIQNIKIQKNYKFGVTNETKELIKERNNVQKLIHLSPNEKIIIHER